jgi:hypothetical protein
MLKSFLKNFKILINFFYSLRVLEDIKINQGKILIELSKLHPPYKNLQDYEFKIFSQWGEDGIIQRLVNNIEIKNKTFIEFGVEDFLESNCRFLMVNNNWSGYVIDSSDNNIKRLKHSSMYWKYDLHAVSAFINKKNINRILRESNFDSDLGILSIDIDGVDYWIFQEIEYFRPRILILEYNSIFGEDRTITVPYEEDFFRTKKHYSNLYYGASLPALIHLASKKGYSLVGTSSAGGNAFFVLDTLLNEKISPVTLGAGFTLTKTRESRDRRGNLTYLNGDSRLKAIRGLPVVNVLTGRMEDL